MMRDQERYFSSVTFFLDCLFILFSFAVSVPLCGKIAGFMGPYLKTMGIGAAPLFHWERHLAVLPLLLAVFLFFHRFRHGRGLPGPETVITMAARAARPCLPAGLLFVLFAAFGNSPGPDFLFAFIFLLLSWLLIPASRLLVLIYVRFERKKGRFSRHVLLAGTGDEAREAARLFEDNPGWGVHPVGFLTGEKDEVGTTISNCKVIGVVVDLPAALENDAVDTILYTGGADNVARIRELAGGCEVMGIDRVLDESGVPRNKWIIGRR